VHSGIEAHIPVVEIESFREIESLLEERSNRSSKGTAWIAQGRRGLLIYYMAQKCD
jgi:hypothetical protein